MNFDNITAGNIGAINYLGKTQPPAELLGCFTLNNTASDLSRYNGNISGTLTYYNSDWVADTKMIGGTSAVIINLGKPLDLSAPWSFDVINYKTTSGWNGSLIFTFGPITFRQASDYQTTEMTDGTTTTRTADQQDPAWFIAGNNPLAFRYDGNGHIDFFTSGVRRYSFNFDLSNAQPITAFTVTFRGAYSQSAYFQNFRVVQKYIGTTTAYPVPSALYTGFETL